MTDCNPAGTANSAYTSLLNGVTFPTLDLSGITTPTLPDFDPDLFTGVGSVTLADLTTAQIDGTGAYDVLMRTYAEHLESQRKLSRITNDNYAKVYMEGQAQVLQAATQFVLNKDQAKWAAITAQQSAITARVQAATALVEFEKAKLQTQMVAYQTENAKAEYAVTKMRLATAQAEFCTAEYNLEHILPEQKNQLVAQTALATAQKLNVEATTSHLTTKEGPKVTAETNNLVKQGTVLERQASLILEQTEQTRAQTMDTRIDGVTTVKGVMGKQKDLHTQQIESYKRDQEYKFLKILTDAWVTQKTMDEGLLPPDIFANASIQATMASYKSKVSL